MSRVNVFYGLYILFVQSLLAASLHFAFDDSWERFCMVITRDLIMPASLSWILCLCLSDARRVLAFLPPRG